MPSGSRLMSQLRTAAGETTILGYVVYWSVKNVEISQEWFRDRLNAAGLDGNRYAREHNFRSAYLRCIRAMEEQRIIRKVMEDAERIVFQFTAEHLNDSDPQDLVLEYRRETTIEIDKDVYWTEGDFAEAVTKCDPALKEILVQRFERERKTYRSTDVTRYIQKIFSDRADLVALRPQGSVYFVPAVYQDLITRIADILRNIPVGEATLDYLPIPDVESARNAVSNGVESEVIEAFAKMEDEIREMNSGSKDITEKWIEHRQRRIMRVKDRIEKYAEILGETAEKLTGKFDALSAILRPRIIEV